MSKFKEGDLVYVKKGRHLTCGCDEFQKLMEELKYVEYQFELGACCEAYDQTCWYITGEEGGEGWVIAESDLELVNFTLENE
ncbi:hypothetical protein [Citrobacter phage CVT22]|uniref:Uncharacterized protein n=1 Tax=Citrobacter phage CVT22 TaxID=1622234 RepID=A0A0R6BA57_9CAUD|nr:hypothetical protein APL39_gp56 [Citrobacter phage CVT22]AJT60760.1 hypothetical protein [Citrobacter phage CVT22]